MSEEVQKRLDKGEAKPVSGNAPIARHSFGAVTVSTWLNKVSVRGKEVELLSFTAQRFYKDKAGENKYTNSFGEGDVFPLINALWLAWAEAKKKEV